MQVMLEATVVTPMLHLAQVTNNSFRNHLGSFFSKKRLATQTASLLVIILFKNQIQTTSASPCRTQVQPAASFLVCSLIFIEYSFIYLC